MAMPKRIHLGPLTYRVTTRLADWQELAADEMEDGSVDAWGFTHHTTGTILINPDSHPGLQRVTLLHEILHAAAFTGGALDNRKRDEESWVVMAAAPLLDALTRSPGLLAYLGGG